MNYTQITKDKPDLAEKVDSLSNELLFCYEELDFIFETGNMLSSIAREEVGDWKSIANEILDNSLEVFEADFGWVYFINEQDSSIEIKELKGIDGARAEDISSLVAARIEDGAFLLDDLTSKGLGIKRKLSASVLICAPFKSEEKTFGAMILGRSDGPVFTSSHMKLLSHFSGYCAQFFENAKMFQEIKEAYRLSEEANIRLTKLNQMKENFISITSHELKTPLSMISICLDIIKNNDLDVSSNNVDKVVTTMEDGLSRLERVVRNICLTSRLEAGNIVLNMEKLSILGLIETVVKEMGFLVNDRRIVLNLNISPDLKIFGDIGAIGDVVCELILNAAKHTPDGGEIGISAEKRERGHVISVYDEGPGIPEEEKDFIFDKFYKVGDYLNHKSGTYKYNTGGICVGLATIKAMVEAHGGSVWVDISQDSHTKGCSFNFFIPDGEGNPFNLKGRRETL